MTNNVSDSFGARLAAGELALFDGVPSATSAADRRSLLGLQAAVRRDGAYAYLEIGSYLGGTLQPHCADPLCRRIYSIDKRTPTVADVRGVVFTYQNNTSAEMMAGLRASWGESVGKILAFDCDARDVPAGSIDQPPALCFIDGEHTVGAVCADFAFCRRVAGPDAIIAFHDDNLIFQALAACRRELRREGIAHRTVKLPGAVYAILLGRAIQRHGPWLAFTAENETWFRLRSVLLLPWLRIAVRLQPLWLRLIWTAITWRKRLRAALRSGR